MVCREQIMALLVNDYTHKYNPNPRLSASQIAEYLHANATSRRRIIVDAKYPPTFITVRYDEARDALRKHLTKKNTARNVLGEASDALKQKQTAGASDWWLANYKMCIQAIDAFQAAEKQLGLDKMTFKLSGMSGSKLPIKGVSVSVSLDLLTEVQDKGKTSIGGAVLCFWKTPAGKQRAEDIPKRCQAIAMLISEVVKKLAAEGQICDPKLCIAVDVFGGKVYAAKPQQKMLYKSVEISCDEVATIWPTVEPPPNYNGPPVLKK